MFQASWHDTRSCKKLSAVGGRRQLHPIEAAQNCEAEFDTKGAGLSDKVAVYVLHSDRGAVFKDLKKPRRWYRAEASQNKLEAW